MKKIIIAVLVLALAGAAFWAFTRTDESPDLVLWGNVDQREVDLAFLDSERIAEVLAEEGSAVKKGQVLARLETRRLRDRIAASEAALAAAEAALKRDLNGTRPRTSTARGPRPPPPRPKRPTRRPPGSATRASGSARPARP